MDINKDIKLISLVQQYEHIYDQKHHLFSSGMAKKSAWLSIAKAMDVPASVCENRFKNIRGKYSRCKKTEGDMPENSNWPLYSRLKFLDPHIRKRVRYPYRDKIKQNDVDPLEDSNSMLFPDVVYEIANQFDQTADDFENENNHLKNENNSIIKKISVPLIKKIKIEPETEKMTENDLDDSVCNTMFLLYKQIKDKKKKKQARIAIFKILEEAASGSDSD